MRCCQLSWFQVSLGVNDIAVLQGLGATLFQPKPLDEDLLVENVAACVKQCERNRAALMC